MVTTNVEVDNQHGPIIRVCYDGEVVAIYLMDETAVVTNCDGQYGLEVTGPWKELKKAMATIAESAYTMNINRAQTVAEVERLSKCCAQRGARMQILHDAVMSAYNYETSGPLWEAVVRAKDWFDADGVPK